MLRYGVVLIACGVLTFVAVRNQEPEPPTGAPGPVELVEWRAPAVLGQRTTRPTARKVVRRRSSDRSASDLRSARPARAPAAVPRVAVDAGGSLSAEGGPSPPVEGTNGSTKSVNLGPRRPTGEGPASRERPVAPITAPVAPAPAPATSGAAVPPAEDVDVEEPADDDPVEPTEEADDD